MATAAEGTDISTAVAATLLRAYGFAPKNIVELLGDRGFYLTNFEPAPGATDFDRKIRANFNKVLTNGGKIDPVTNIVGNQHRHRLGGTGSPSWLPVGEVLIDFLARRLGFNDESDMDDFTLNTVGQIDFEPSVEMGEKRGSTDEVQRNLTTAHWDYCGANAGTAAKGDLKQMQAHSMDDAIDAVLTDQAYDLASHRLSPGAASRSSGAALANTGTSAAASAPSPPPLPPAPTGANTVPPGLDSHIELVMGEDGVQPASKQTSWASLNSLRSLPTYDTATRELNSGVWDERQSGTRPGAFGDDYADQKFYPATEPVYVVLNRNYLGADFGPIDDFHLSRIFNDQVTTQTLESRDRSEYAGIAHMIIALANGERPIYRLVTTEGTYSDWFDLTMNLGKSGPGNAKNCRELEDLRIQWEPVVGEPGKWIPKVIKFSLAASGSDRDWPGIPFTITMDPDGVYEITVNGSTPTTMEAILNPIENAAIGLRNVVVQQEVSDPGTITRQGFMLLPWIENPDVMTDPTMGIPGQKPDYISKTSLTDEDQMKRFITYDLASNGLAGVDDTADDYATPYRALIFPATGVSVFTNIDQYASSPFVGLYLSRPRVDWATDAAVYALADDQIANFELSIRDGADTTSQYAGFTGSGDQRRIRLYVRGDIPENLTPLGIPRDSSLTSVQAYPLGNPNPDRIRLNFTNPDGSTKSYTIPDDSLKATFVDSQDRPVVGDVVLSDGAYINLQSGIPQTDIPVLMRQINNGRLANRVSELNHNLPVGASGLRKIVYQDGTTINIIAEDPNDSSRLVHLIIYPRQPGDLI